MVKGVDLRSTTGNCAWVRTPQLTPSDAPGCGCRTIWCGCHRLSSGGHLSAALRPAARAGIHQQSRPSRGRQGTRDEIAESAAPRSQFARVVKGVDLRSTAGNCARARTPQLTDLTKHSVPTCLPQDLAGKNHNKILTGLPTRIHVGTGCRRGCRPSLRR